MSVTAGEESNKLTSYEENSSFQFDGKYKKIFEKSSDGICVISIPRDSGPASYLEVNDQYCSMTG